jgi:8-oxo-dGTP diphosphatase
VTEQADRPLAVDRHSNALVSCALGAEDSPPADAPLPLSLVALWHRDRVLMVFDRSRQVWELPGGMIDPGETPRQAALRELREETGQRPDEPLRFVGYPRFVLGPARRVEYTGLFTGHTTTPRTFRANDEIEAAHWWDQAQPPSRRGSIAGHPPGPAYPQTLATDDHQPDPATRLVGRRI